MITIAITSLVSGEIQIRKEIQLKKGDDYNATYRTYCFLSYGTEQCRHSCVNFMFACLCRASHATAGSATTVLRMLWMLLTRSQLLLKRPLQLSASLLRWWSYPLVTTVNLLKLFVFIANAIIFTYFHSLESEFLIFSRSIISCKKMLTNVFKLLFMLDLLGNLGFILKDKQ